MKAPTDVPRGRDYLAMLARGWVIIALATLLSMGAAWAATGLRAPEYEASASVFAEVAGDPGVFSAYAGGMAANARVPTYIDLATSNLVAGRAIEELKLDTAPAELASRVSGEWVPGGANAWGRANSALIRISVTARDPDTAVKTVNSLAGHLVALSRELEWGQSKETDPIQYTGPAAELVPVDRAHAAHLVTTPLWRTLAIGAGLGLACGALMVLGMGIVRDRVATRGQLDHIVKQATHADA